MPVADAPQLKVRPHSWVRNNVFHRGTPFSFDGREYLVPIYDSPSPKVFIKAGRQVEKTAWINSRVMMAGGSWKRAGDVEIGDRLATLDCESMRMRVGHVTWKSRIYRKPCRRITTMLGHEAVMALTHPVRIWNGWVETSMLAIGSRLAAVRKAGLFGSHESTSARIAITAGLIGDGHIHHTQIGFTGSPGPILEAIKDALEQAGNPYAIYPKKGTPAVAIHIKRGIVRTWMTEDGLLGKKSAEKFVPAWVFRLPRAQTALFLNRLWATDGHVKKNGPSQYSIEYCSISPRLIKEVQSLLWKFGIPSTIRKNWPNIYKKRGERKYAYILRVITSAGARRFLSEIGALGKSEGVPLPDAHENNNRDTLPIEVGELIREIRDTAAVRVGRYCGATLYSNGLRLSPKFSLTYDKAALYVSFFKGDPEFDQDKVSRLERLLERDVYWDRVKRIEDVGEQDCVDFEVEGTHNFVLEGLITHNSTTLCNKAITELYCNPYTNGLYVSSSSHQTGVFSTSVMKAELLESPELRGSWYRPGSAYYVDKVYEKEFTNHSRMFFRYAFLTADRVRGIAARLLEVDEIQDIILKNLPIIEECTSHYMASRIMVYAGTPKTYENAVEAYWRRSTMKEWVVHCDACNHWNVLGEDNVKEKGLSCDKCESLINPRNGMWARFGPEDAEFDGYRISQLMVSWTVWKEIWVKYKHYPKQQFFNEVLGLSCEQAASVITQIDLMRACVAGGYPMYKARPTDRYYQALFGGVDWGKGLGSLTVHVIGGFHDNCFEVVYMKKYDPSRMETREIVSDIAKTNFIFRVVRCGADWGSGYMENQELQRAMRPIHVWQYYSSGTQKAMVAWNKKGHFWVINRNAVIGDLFNAIKRGQVKFFRWKDFQPFSMDFLGVFPDYHSHTRVLYYNHPADIADDAVHATNYARTSALVYSGMGGLNRA